MDFADFSALAQQCAPAVHIETMQRLVKVESGFNPFAIGVVGGQLARQPANKAEAVATAKALDADGFNFSLGLTQVNRYNLAKQGLDYESVFEACPNLRAGANILQECFGRARQRFATEQQALQASFSCYYSGNFSTGFVPEGKQPSYVQKILGSGSVGAVQQVKPIAVIRTARPPQAAAKPAAGAVVRVSAEQSEGDSTGGSAMVYGDSNDQGGRSVMVYR